jgi:hypothetical protein
LSHRLFPKLRRDGSMSRTQVIALVLTENDSTLIAVVNRPSGYSS